MVAKFLDDSKSKRHLKSGFALFHTLWILIFRISFNLSKVDEMFWVKSERTVSKYRKTKTKTKRWCCAHLIDEAGE